MPNITVECPHCKTCLETPYSLIGNEVICPACQRRFTVKAPAEADEEIPLILPKTKGNVNFLTSKWPLSHIAIFTVCSSVLALLLSIAALSIALSLSGNPQMKFYTDPEQALKGILEFKKNTDSSGNYFWRKNGDKILDSLNVVELKLCKEDTNWVVVFYQWSLGITHVRKAMILYKANDGVWIEFSTNGTTKRPPEKWYTGIKKEIDKFEKGSGRFDTLDL